jgi:hypothetical protein
MDAAEALGGSRTDRGVRTVGPYLRRYGIYIFLISFLCVYYVTNGELMLGHYDLGWHLAAGDVIRQQGHVPLHDPWSFTAADKQWFNLSWLWDVVASFVFQYAGFGGLIFIVVASGAATAGYLASLCLRSGASTASTGIAVFAACLLYPAFAAAPNIYLAASPNTATMLFAVLFYGECLKRSRWLLGLPAVMVLWANLHGGFLLGFFVIGVFGGVALLRRDWAGVRVFALVGAACLVATLINPLGWRLYEGSAATLGHFVQAYITEWQSYYQNMEMPESIPGMIYVLLFVALELLFFKNACPVEARLLSWLFLLLGIYQFRYMSFFFLFSTLPLALHLDRLLARRLDNFKVQNALAAAGIMGACALPVTYAQARPSFTLPHMISEQDARYLQTHLPQARLLNHWNVGGLLIFYTRGSVPLFVDGRAATAYPDGLLRDYFPLVAWEVDEAAWDAVIEKYKIDTVLWVKAHEQLRRFLVDKRGWKEEYAGNFESIYVKPVSTSQLISPR